MSHSDHALDGLESILATFAQRFEFDVDERLVASRIEGNLPRFVLGRSAAGCVWRFAVGLEPEKLRSIAKLAGREPGFPITGNAPAPTPERLVMIERILAGDGAEVEARHEILMQGDDPCAEIWTID